MIRFVCECGKQLQAREENAGKLAMCPACKRQQRIPDLPPTAIQTEDVVESVPEKTGVRRSRPAALRDETEQPAEGRSRRSEAKTGSGKAIASLFLGILSLCGCTCLTGLPSIVLGILSLRDIGRAAGMLTGKGSAIAGIVLGSLGTLCWPVVGIPAWFVGRDAADRATAVNNLRQMALAMHSYNDTYGILPPAGIGSPLEQGRRKKPLLSWRVALLPYLDEDTLYKQFNLNEPWDGPTNRKLLAKMPRVYKLPGDSKTPPDHTVFQVFTGPRTLFEPNQIIRIPASIIDGTSNTLMIVEAALGVPWTKPEDIPFDPGKPVTPLVGGHYRNIFLAVFADGIVHMLPQNTPDTTLKAMITCNGADVFNWP
jgi:hypothetical protein